MLRTRAIIQTHRKTHSSQRLLPPLNAVRQPTSLEDVECRWRQQFEGVHRRRGAETARDGVCDLVEGLLKLAQVLLIVIESSVRLPHKGIRGNHVVQVQREV